MRILDIDFLRYSAAAVLAATVIATASPADATGRHHFKNKEAYCKATYSHLSFKLKWYEDKIAKLDKRDGDNRQIHGIYRAHRAMYKKHMHKWKHSCATQVSCDSNRNDDACEPVISGSM